MHTSPETVTAVEGFVTGTLGKTVIRSRDRAGFVVNALLIPYLLAAVRMAESGFATAADIDTGMERGCAHPMGPLKLAVRRFPPLRCRRVPGPHSVSHLAIRTPDVIGRAGGLP